ncbi:helix-turn-helix domain-containing protein [Vibrio maerlii]|uniref:helix-turn-helix domain-containing protein n=1 Tax=Vibrio maerlii TaxID=2231648 RepID=UPI000E3DECEC|nr:AraC family transcriptional regulator [Vibrio maerlii]
MNIKIAVIGSDTSLLNKELNLISESEFEFIKCNMDVSRVSDPDTQFVFFTTSGHGLDHLYRMSINLCSNLGKSLVLFHHGEMLSTVNHNSLLQCIDLSKENASDMINKLITQVSYQSVGYNFYDSKNKKSSKFTSQISVDEVTGFIKQNLNSNIREEDIAQRCHCSITHFSKQFHKQIGISFRDYICEERVKLAKDLIRSQPSDKFAVIAYQCGYHDVSYFTRAFKKRTGITPSGYRQSLLSKQN